MKMNRKNTTTILTTILLLTLTLFSCKDSILSQPKENPDGKTYLVVKSADISTGNRSIEPDMNAAFARMTSVVLWGTKTKNADGQAVTDTDGARTRLSYNNSAYTLQNLLDSVILLEKGAGEYTFELEGNLDDIYYYEQLTGVSISASQTNPISFTLEPKNKDSNNNLTDFGDFGGIKIRLNYNIEKSPISQVMVTVTSINDAGVEQKVESKPLSPTTNGNSYNKYVEYKRWAATTDSGDTTMQIAPGTYRVTFDFYMDSETIINSLPYIVHVVRGLNSIYEDTIDLNEVYSISYQNANTSNLADGQVMPQKYTRKSNFVLPRVKKSGQIFQGWFTGPSGSGDQVFSIPNGNLENKTLYAYFKTIGNNANNVPPTLYINPSATYHYGNSDTYGLSTLDEALEIVKTTTSAKDWTIMVTGELKGPQTITVDKTGTSATSITIQGSRTGSTEPLDTINGDFKAPTPNGAAIAVTTTVPITLNNLKITGGNNDGTGDIKGGGLYVGSGTKVTLTGSTLINGNTAVDGGGIYMLGQLTMDTSTVSGNIATNNGGGMYCQGGPLYIYNDAVIGDRSATTAASGPTDCSNFAAGDGGGIYAKNASILMGLTNYANNYTAAPEWTGGIYYNYASNGGGIYTIGKSSCDVRMFAGTLANNGVPADGHGGAVYQGTNYMLCGFGMGYTALIPAGDDGKHDVYLSNSDGLLQLNRININNTYYYFNHDSTVTSFVQVTPGSYTANSKILEGDAFNDSNQVSSFINKISITPEIDEENSVKRNWKVKSISGGGALELVNEEPWSDPNTFYVGDNSVDGDGTQSNPFKSFSLACDEIATRGTSDQIYTIKVIGSVSGEQELTSDINGKASEIRIQGANGLSNGVPQDEFNGDLVYNNVLNIKTTVPVTITNLKITQGETGILAGYDSATSSIVNVNVTLGTGCLITDNGGSAGIFVEGGKVILDGASVTNNRGDYGGGVRVHGGEFVMQSGTIGGTSEDDANTADYKGAGVYVCGGTFTMKGGSICGNGGSWSSVNGAGVYVGFDDDPTPATAGTFILEGGTITNNTSTGDGKGVYVDYDSENTPRFIVSKDAAIASNNEVYLASGAKILVRNNINSSSDKIATFMPQTYDTTEVFVQAESGSLTSQITDRFDVAPFATDTYALNSSGKIYQTGEGSTTSDWQVSYVGHYYVDLGLPSGTLWSTKNYGASDEEDVGTVCTWDYSEYKNDTEDNWGPCWDVANSTQWQELVNNCYWVFSYQSPANGYGTAVNGYIVYKALKDTDKGQFCYFGTVSNEYTESVPHIYIPLESRWDVEDANGSYWTEATSETTNLTAVQYSFTQSGTDIQSNVVNATGEGWTDSDTHPIRLVRNAFVPTSSGSIAYSTDILPSNENENDYVTITIPAMLVGKSLVTQAEYEKYMTYYGVVNNNTALVPAETGAEKDTAPAKFVSWIEAIVYCNLRSVAEGLSPVYYMLAPEEDPEYSPSEWTGYSVAKKSSGGKDYYYSNATEGQYVWDTDSNFRIDETANGYRLPTSAELEYLVGKDIGLESVQDVNEWSQTYVYDQEAKRAYLSGDINNGGTVANHMETNSYRGQDMGFRVIRYR